jgi:hypothetical protein
VRFVERTPINVGRLTGACYLAVFLTGFVYLALIPHIGLTGSDFGQAVNDIVAHQTAFWVGYAAFLASIALRLILMLLFYELFKPVNKNLSRLAVSFNIVATSVQAAMAVFLLVPIALLTHSHDHLLASFTLGQLHDLAALALQLNYYGYTIALVFFGGYDILIGYLAYKSGFIPRAIGVLMVITGIGWLTYIAPDTAANLVPLNLIAGVVGETAMILWLLLNGADAKQPSTFAHV